MIFGRTFDELFEQLVWVFLLAVPVVVIVAFWWKGVHPATLFRAGNFLTVVGDLAGLLAAYAILLQIILMARVTWLEEAFGLNELNWFHQWNGYAVYGLIVAHAVLLTLGYSVTYKTGVWVQFLSFVFTFPDVLKALLGVVVLTVSVVMSVTIIRKRLPYESWYAVHLMAYGVVLLVFSHQLSVGPSFIAQPLFVNFWWGIYLAVFFLLVWFRAGRLVWLLLWHQFRIERVEQETADTVSMYVGGKHLDGFKYAAGQYAIWRILTPQLWWQGHPFSFSQEWNGRNIRISVKGSGDYTRSLLKLKPGSFVLVDGPHGKFTPARLRGDKVLLVAGGIGVTPLRAMLDEMLKEGRDVVLVYAARTVGDVAFQSEIESFISRGLEVHYVYSRESGEPRRIDQALLSELVPDAAEREVFICGPEPMMAAVERVLRKIGVSRKKIYTEAFAF